MEVRTLAGEPELVIVHVEIQREREERFNRRMWRYYTALSQREDKPIIPIALIFYEASEGIMWELYEETLFGHTIIAFRYLQISLPRLSPREYLGTSNVLAAGLASVMGPPLRGAARAALHLDCLRRLLALEQAGQVDPAKADLLADLVETYLPISVEDREELRLQLQAEGVTTMEATELTWRSRIDLEVTLRTLREAIREATQVRFGRVSPEVEAMISDTDSEDELRALFRRAVAAQTESDLLQPAS